MRLLQMLVRIRHSHNVRDFNCPQKNIYQYLCGKWRFELPHEYCTRIKPCLLQTRAQTHTNTLSLSLSLTHTHTFTLTHTHTHTCLHNHAQNNYMPLSARNLQVLHNGRWKCQRRQKRTYMVFLRLATLHPTLTWLLSWSKHLLLLRVRQNIATSGV